MSLISIDITSPILVRSKVNLNHAYRKYRAI